MRRASRIRRALIGRDVTFHGYDGRDYSARVAAVRRAVATVVYTVPGVGPVTAYICDARRLDVRPS